MIHNRTIKPQSPSFLFAQHFFKHHQTFFENLHDRWQDEKEYEDFADYEKAIAKAWKTAATKAGAPKAKLVRVTSRPFRVLLSVAGEQYQINITNRIYSMDRLIS